MHTEKTCAFCFDLLPIGTTHKQVPLGSGTQCEPTTCPTCHGRGVLAAAFEGWQPCPTCKPTLAESPEEATRMLYSQRGMPALREPKIFDHTRAEAMPLFEPATKKLF
jgi:hypothetical protein